MTRSDLAGIGAWAAHLKVSDVDAAAVDVARNCIVDVTGVCLAARQEPLARQALAHAQAQYGSGPCTVIGTGTKTSGLGAALANGAASHTLDFDDTSYAGILHGSAVIWPACLAAAQMAGASGPDLLASFIAGSEIEYALGLALTEDFYFQGWWTTAALGVVGAAAASARAMRAGPDVTAHAIALAACQAFGLRSSLGTMAKPYLCGRASQTGLDAALAAAAGFTGPFAALTDRFGLAHVMNGRPLPDDAFSALGQRWSLLEPGVAFKLFPICSAAQAAVEATLELMAENGIGGNEVDAVVCEVPPLVSMCLRCDRPDTANAARFSMPFAIGSALAFGELGLGQLTDDVVTGEAISRVLPKVSMITRDDLAATAEQRRDAPESAIVTITTSDGRRFSRFRATATGMPQTPMSAADIDRKFRRCASRTLETRGVERLLSRLRALELEPTIADLGG
jgi:2-methylcitrate dehydratase PrpD